LEAYPPVGVIFTGIGILLSVRISIDISTGSVVTSISQAAQDVRTSQDLLIDLFERIENVFRRLETYIEVPPTTGMTDAIVKVMVEVLRIIAIATKEIKQNRASELTISYKINPLDLLFFQKNS
jgi:hypothetical protein